MYQREVIYVDSRSAHMAPRLRPPPMRRGPPPPRRRPPPPRLLPPPAQTVEVVHRYHISADPDLDDDVIEQATQQLIAETSQGQDIDKFIIERVEEDEGDDGAEEQDEVVYAEDNRPKKNVQFGVQTTKYYRPPSPENRTGPMTVTVKVPTEQQSAAFVQHQYTPQQLHQLQHSAPQVRQQPQQQQQFVFQSYPSAQQILEELPQPQSEPIQVQQVLQFHPQLVHQQQGAATTTQALPPWYAMFSQIAQITDYLYLSGCHALQHPKLRALGITHVVNATKEIGDVTMPEISSIRVLINDVPSAQLSGYFDKVADKVDSVRKSGGRVLIHCVAGVSRSASLVIAYLMKYHRMSLREAYTHVKSRRAVIRPNAGFFKQLIAYEKKLFGSNSVKMISSNIGNIPDVYTDEAKNMVYLK